MSAKENQNLKSLPMSRHLVEIFDEERIIAFSDAVFAFAITLLVIKIDLPNIPDHLAASRLHIELFNLWPQYLSNIISFIVIGNYWLVHHRIFILIKKYDYTLIWINILLLMCISFIPFSTEIFGDYDNYQVSVIFYAGTMAIVGVVQNILWWYASSRHRLIDPHVSNRFIQYYTLRSLISPMVFFVSIALAFVNIQLAKLSWILIFILLALLHQEYNKQEKEESQL